MLLVLAAVSVGFAFYQYNARIAAEKDNLQREVQSLKTEIEADDSGVNSEEAVLDVIENEGGELSGKEVCERDGIIAKNDNSHPDIQSLNKVIDEAYTSLVVANEDYNKTIAKYDSKEFELYLPEEQAEIDKLMAASEAARESGDIAKQVEASGELGRFYAIHGGLLERLDAYNQDKKTDIENAQYVITIAQSTLDTFVNAKAQLQENLYTNAYEICLSQTQ